MIDEDFKTKIAIVRDQNGGVQGYSKLNNDLGNFRRNVEEHFK